MPKLISRRSAPGLVLAGVLLAATIAAATASARPTRTHASIQACALLPDTKSSTRYTLFDAPYLKKAFKAAGVSATVLNALGDPQKQKSQAQQCLAQGAKVILLDQLDPASGASITNLAVGQGAKVIDYDRLVVGSKASYYVSFDNVKVGKLQGKGLVSALRAKGKYGSHPVIAELKAHGLKPVPLTGQDATPTGVQFILAGWQSGTVYKSVRKEANAAAAAAIALVKGKKVPGVNGKVSGTKSILLTPVWITKANYKLLFKEGFLKRSQVCNGQYKKFCK